MVPRELALARLRLPDGDGEALGEREQRILRLAVGHAAARDEQGTLCVCDQLCRRFDFPGNGEAAVQIPHALLQEVIGVVERFALHILRHGKADCARLGRVREHTHCVDRRRHELLGAGDAVPIFAHGAERVVGSGLIAARLLNLLEHRVRLAAGKGMPEKRQITPRRQGTLDAYRPAGAAAGYGWPWPCRRRGPYSARRGRWRRCRQ